MTCDRVVVATGGAILDRSLVFARAHPERSYCIEAEIDGDPPAGMFISAGSETRSLRAHATAEGERLIVGGEGHKVGQGAPHEERYERLEAFAHEHFNVRRITQRGVADAGCVGRLDPRTGHRDRKRDSMRPMTIARALRTAAASSFQPTAPPASHRSRSSPGCRRGCSRSQSRARRGSRPREEAGGFAVRGQRFDRPAAGLGRGFRPESETISVSVCDVSSGSARGRHGDERDQRGETSSSA